MSALPLRVRVRALMNFFIASWSCARMRDATGDSAAPPAPVAGGASDAGVDVGECSVPVELEPCEDEWAAVESDE
jgi:hypothetical protein